MRFASTTENHSRRQIFESIQKHAFPASYKETFFAYNFKYHENLNGFDGWNIYDAEAEYKRMVNQQKKIFAYLRFLSEIFI